MATPLIAFLLVQAVAAAAAPADDYGRSVDATSRLRGAALNAYFSVDDYPVRAERNEEQGAVHFRLAIAPDGSVAQCIVTRSSGSATLDTATCRALSARVRYAPLRRQSGGRTATSDQALSWRLALGGPRRPRLPDPIPHGGGPHTAPGRDCSPTAPAAPPGTGAAVRAVPTPSHRLLQHRLSGRRVSAEWQGDVRFALDIGASGRVTDCRIRLERRRRSMAQPAGSSEPRRFTPARCGRHPVPDTIVRTSAGGWTGSGTSAAPSANRPLARTERMRAETEARKAAVGPAMVEAGLAPA